MRRLLLLTPLALAACSTTGLTPSLNPSAQLAVKKAETSAEIGFGLLEQAYIAGEPYFNAHPDDKATAKALVAQGLDLLHAARNAETLGDTAAITAKIAAIGSLTAEVTKLAKGTAK